MAHRPYSKVVYGDRTEHVKREMKEMARAHYGFDPPAASGSSTPRLLAMTSFSSMSSYGEGEEGEVGERFVDVCAEGEGAPVAFAPMLALKTSSSTTSVEPGAVMDDSEMQRTRQWLSSERLTKAIPVFEENEVILAEITELSEEEFEDWLSELPLGVLQKKRLRKAVAKLHTAALPRTKSEIYQMEIVEELKECAVVEADMETSALPMQTKSTPFDDEKVEMRSAHKSTESIATEFSFDVKTEKELAKASDFEVSDDLKTATKKKGFGHMLLSPAVGSGSHSVRLRVEHRTGFIGIAVIDECGGYLDNGCCFYDDGQVCVNRYIDGSEAVPSHAFGGWQKGDIIAISVTLHSDSCDVLLKTPNGEYSTKWKPRSTPVWFAFYGYTGTALSIV